MGYRGVEPVPGFRGCYVRTELGRLNQFRECSPGPALGIICSFQGRHGDGAPNNARLVLSHFPIKMWAVHIPIRQAGGEEGHHLPHLHLGYGRAGVKVSGSHRQIWVTSTLLSTRSRSQCVGSLRSHRGPRPLHLARLQRK